MENTQTTPTTETATTAPAAATTTPTPSKPKAKNKPHPAAKAPKKAAKPKAAKKAKAPRKAGKQDSAEMVKALSEAAKEYVHDKKHKTANGNVSVHNGDKVAKLLLGKTLDEVYKIAAGKLQEPESALRAKYKHLNVGMQRMNLGNRIRAA